MSDFCQLIVSLHPYTDAIPVLIENKPEMVTIWLLSE
jgi:hypothetical protein